MSRDYLVVDCENSVQVKWTITNFNGYSLFGQRAVSPAFTTPSLGCSEPWFIVCWPRGNKKENAGYISCALFTRNRIDYTYQISESHSNTCSALLVIKGNQFIAIPRFRESNSLCYSSITLTCKITINIDADNHNQETTLREAISQNKTQAMTDLVGLSLDKSSSDVEIIGRNRRFPAHKLILSSRSPVFKAMFSSDMKENNENTVEIKDLDDDVLKDMVKYIYSGTSPNLVELAPRLIVAADKYDLGGLKDLCELQLIQNLSIENFCYKFSMSDQCKLEKLKSACLSWSHNNMNKILKMPEFNELIFSKPEMLIYIIQSYLSCDDNKWVNKIVDCLSK